MIDWFFIFIPIVAAVILLIFWMKKVVWWEIALLIVPSAILILLLNTIMVAYRTSDTEYLGYYTVKTTYYEPWNERVSCRHPIYCTRTYPCGSGKSRHTCTSTYVCGHHHAYDVDYHPAHWTKTDNSGDEISISQQEYERLQKQFNTKTYFVELNRHYHTIDGDAYSVDWGKEPERSDAITKEGSYTNKIRASHSVFKFEDIEPEDASKMGLYDYPAVNDYRQSVVLGWNVDAMTERKLQYINGFYGSKKQFKMFILFFKGKSMDIVHKQRSYWEGGNKNEFVICMGTNNFGGLEWVKCFSWMDKPELEVEVESYLSSQENIDLKAFSEWMPKQVEEHWHRKDFKDFDYLQVELTETQLWWVMIIIMLYNIGMAIWIVFNEIENDRIDHGSGHSKVYKFIDRLKQKIKGLFVKSKS